MKRVRMLVLGSSGLALMLAASSASAELKNLALLDTVVTEFSTRAQGWKAVMMNAASWLFWTLGTISLVWTAGMMVLRKADLAEFFAEFIRFILFFGFFLWLLRNGPAFAQTIIESMKQLGAQASGMQSISVSGIVDIGFLIWKQAISNLSLLDPIESLVGIILSGAILLLLAAIAVNMLLLLISGWILMYAGIFFLGFGGSRWTSDMAINYYKTVLGIAVQLLAMVLLVGIGNDLLGTFYNRIGKVDNNFSELAIVLVFCLALLMLSSKIPAMVAGIITGGAGASGDIGSLGAGAVMGAAMGAAGAASAAASMAGSVLASGAANAAGGAQALMAAYSQASAAGSDAGGLADAAGSSASVFADMDQGKGADDSADDGSEGGGGGKDSRSGSEGSSEGGKGSGSGGEGGGQGASSQAGEIGQAQSGAAGTSQDAGMLGRAAATAAGTASQLAQGSLAVGKAKIASLREGALERIGQTTGGKVASAIKQAGGPASLGATGHHPSPGSRSAPEVEAFVNRDSRNS
ncbi:P-type conjugative transfer protein TrbL [Acidovorax sp. Be4]|uniref:P-type conjugative transfer protein TrbL n=1 Tax=Acidovorax bellezanensis TaxID=2976702 RepID=A0ABT2PPH1_9BURK|nr:P-type conjugative transfer protein TrbL [Acidovorax sp. Be4]MCT9811087.1 P-type conjugative transfer protein TrbL [Acidovorax sp. Be4]